MLTENSPTFSVGAPPSLLNRPVALDYKAFLKSAAKIAIKGLTGHWIEAFADLPEAIAAVSLGDKPEDRAWILIRRALARAAVTLLQEYSTINPVGAPASEDGFAPDASQPTTFILEIDFFDHPERSDVLLKTTPALQHWLERFGIPKSRARNLSDRLAGYFPIALHNEWRSNPQFYEPIKAAISSPFSAAAEAEIGWHRYKAYLINQIDEPVFGESFSLRQIYVEPRGYFLEKRTRRETDEDLFQTTNGASEDQKKCLWLMQEVIGWVYLWDRDITVRVLAGGPGSGKSSFTKMLSYHLVADLDITVLYIPLHQIDLKLDFVTAVGQFIEGEGCLFENPLRGGTGGKVVLVLDGLDELEMQGRAAQETAQAFVRDVVRTVDLLNARDSRVRVILSGREIAVQGVEGEFRKRGQVLYLLPYHVPNRSGYHDPDQLLELDQRDIWWKKHGELTGQDYSSIPLVLKEEEIGEVTAQPLLNYLVALAYQRGG